MWLPRLYSLRNRRLAVNYSHIAACHDSRVSVCVTSSLSISEILRNTVDTFEATAWGVAHMLKVGFHHYLSTGTVQEAEQVE